MNKKQFFITVFLVLFISILFIFTKSVYLHQTYKNLMSKPTATIVFVPGLDLHANDYRYLIDHLKADHYQVITFTPKDTSVKDYQTTVDKWTKEIGVLIGNKKVIVIGHSVGGSVATYFCSTDKRCVAGVNLDGGTTLDKKIPVPFLYIQADTGSYCDDQCFSGRAMMEKVTSQSGASFVHIGEIKHYNFTDLRTQTLRDQDYLGPIDGRDIIYANIQAFLNELK
jgi:pimeloyl-ACP methyl ester carboxylesterase